MADEITLYPLNNGQYNRSFEMDSEGPFDDDTGRYTGDAPWPVPVTIGGQTGSIASIDAFATYYTEQDDSTGTPPDDDMIVTDRWHQGSFYTYDLSEVATETIQTAYLEIEMSEFDEAWVFGNTWPDDPDVDNGPPQHSKTTTIAVDWLGGTNDQLDSIDALFATKAAEWTFERSATVIDLLEIVDDPYNAIGGTGPRTLRYALDNPAEALAGKDWVALATGFDTLPGYFWMSFSYENFHPNGDPYDATWFEPFNDSAFFTINPVTGVRLILSTVPLEEEDPQPLPDIAISATAVLGIDGPLLRVGGLAESPPDRPILSHAARRRRGW